VPYFLSKYDPDPLRFYLTATAPETRDTPAAILLGGFRRAQQQRTGRHLGPQSVANRMLSFAYKRFDGRVPEPGDLDAEDQAFLEKVEAGFETVGALYNACKFRAALGEALAPPKALRLRRVWLVKRTAT
jgi:methionyl-tRNA synthetase